MKEQRKDLEKGFIITAFCSLFLLFLLFRFFFHCIDSSAGWRAPLGGKTSIVSIVHKSKTIFSGLEIVSSARMEEPTKHDFFFFFFLTKTIGTQRSEQKRRKHVHSWIYNLQTEFPWFFSTMQRRKPEKNGIISASEIENLIIDPIPFVQIPPRLFPEQRSSAEGTRLLAHPHPTVQTVPMEYVTAVHQPPDLVPSLEFAETDRASIGHFVGIRCTSQIFEPDHRQALTGLQCRRRATFGAKFGRVGSQKVRFNEESETQIPKKAGNEVLNETQKEDGV